MPKLLEAAITDRDLERLVCEHRDNAGKAHRLHNTPAQAALYAGVQNGWADIYQELLDRRRASKPPTTRIDHDALALTLSKPR